MKIKSLSGIVFTEYDKLHSYNLNKRQGFTPVSLLIG